MTHEDDSFDLDKAIAAATLDDRARDLARVVFTTDPARSTESGPTNVALIAPNPITGKTDHLESRTLEYRNWLRRVLDPETIALVTQPSVPVTIRCPHCGRSWPSTADFCVLRPGEVAFEETRTEERVGNILAKHPGLYLPVAPGVYQVPGTEEWMARTGATYRVFTERSIGDIESRNLAFLLPHAQRPAPDPEAVRAIREHVIRHEGATIEGLRDAGLDPKTVMAAIAHGVVRVNLDRDVIADPRTCRVFTDDLAAKAHGPSRAAAFAIGNGAPVAVSAVPGGRVLIADTAFDVVHAGPEELLLREAGSGLIHRHRRQDFDGLVASGVIRGDGRIERQEAIERLDDLYARASDLRIRQAQLRAHRLAGGLLTTAEQLRMTGVEGVLRVSARTLRRWRQRRREVERLTGDPVAGLIPMARSGGGRKVDERALVVLEAVVRERVLCASPLGPTDVQSEVRRRLEGDGLGLLAPSVATVRRYMGRLDQREVALAQRGHRAGNALRPHRPIPADSAPPNGEAPWEVVHMDSTEVDIETRCPSTGIGLGRPNLTALVDGYSGMVLVDLLHYADPSGATALRVLRRCVERWGRLPLTLVVDQGPEYHGTAFQQFCAWAGVTIVYRPTAQPRFGSPVERHFLEVRRVVSRLAGQTLFRKDPRTLDADHDPAALAVWDIASLQCHLDRADVLHGDRVRQRTGQSPLDRFLLGIEQQGVAAPRTFDAASIAFRSWTLPLADNGGRRRISSITGISVNYLTYWADVFADPALRGTSVEVRWDPDDMAHVMAFVRDRWVQCEARELRRFRVVSWAEWQAYSEIIRARNVKVGATRRLSGSAVAGLLRSGTATEDQLRARLRAQAEVAAPIVPPTDGDDPPTDSTPPVSSGRDPRGPRPSSPAAVDHPDDLLGQSEASLDERYFLAS